MSTSPVSVHAYVGPKAVIVMPNTVSKKCWLAARSRAGNSMKFGLATMALLGKTHNPMF
jgi:hypothetical protein